MSQSLLLPLRRNLRRLRRRWRRQRLEIPEWPSRLRLGLSTRELPAPAMGWHLVWWWDGIWCGGGHALQRLEDELQALRDREIWYGCDNKVR